ncbi:hypothetical protein GF325_19185 [Candidatus Bathyarchaeota archaeon]|nr:hypothetical protein [Candidatus Bathyarchaeota archaeon]
MKLKSRSGKKKKFKGFLCTTLLLLSFSLTITFILPWNLKSGKFDKNRLGRSFTPHAPVNITSNANFTTSTAVTAGSGTELDPWIIDNWEINASTTGIAISISNTTQHLRINLINITGAGSGTGIKLSDADNIQIEDILINNASIGIHVLSTCSNIGMIANVSMNVEGDGMRIYAGNAFMEDMDVKAGGTGILLAGGGNTVNNSYVHECTGYGISITGNNNNINNTRVENNVLDGIRVSGNLNEMSNVSVTVNSGHGVNIYGQSNTLDSSWIFNNTQSLVILQTPTCSYNNITNNRLNTSFTEVAVKVINAPDNLLDLNNISNSLPSNPNTHGVEISGASSIRNTFQNSHVNVNKTAFLLLSDAGQNVIQDNNITQCDRAVFIQNAHENGFHGNIIDAGFSMAVMLSGSNHIELIDNEISDVGGNSSLMIRNFNSNSTIITSNRMEGSDTCIQIDASNNLNISTNILSNFTSFGIEAQPGASSMLVAGNQIVNSSSGTGIGIAGSGNEVHGNEFSSLVIAIDISDLSQNKTLNEIHGNSVSGSITTGILLDANTSENVVYNNIFALNAVDVTCNNATNIFYQLSMGSENVIGGPNIGGNLWGTYSDYDSDLDGFGNTPYTSTNIIDNYPLVILPLVNSPGDKDYYQGLDGYVIPWEIVKIGPPPVNPQYNVLINGLPYTSGSWSNGTSLDIPVRFSDPAGIYNYTIQYSYDIGLNTQQGIEDSVFINLRPPTYQIVPVNPAPALHQYAGLNMNISVEGNISSNNFYVERVNNTSDLMYQIPSTPGAADGFTVRFVHNESGAFSLNYSLLVGYNDGQIDDASITPYLWNDTSASWIDPLDIGAQYMIDRNLNILNLTLPSNTDLLGEFVFIGTPVLQVSTDKTYYNNTETISISTEWFNINGASLTLQINNSAGVEVYKNASWGITNSTGEHEDVLNISMVGGLDNDNFTIFIFANNGTHQKTNIYYPTTMIVDSVAPGITIDNPLNGSFHNQLFWINSTMVDDNLDDTSFAYYIDSSRYSFNGNETINVIFDSLAEGWHNITVEALDLSLNYANESVLVYKDYTNPVVVVTNPSNNTYQNESFTINTTITDDNFESTYYRIDSYSNDTYSFTGNDTIDSGAFDSLPDGSHFVIVYANDTAGNEHSYRIDFVKDTDLPTVNILSPSQGLVTNQTFEINTEIDDLYPDTTSMFYRIDSPLNTSYPFNGNESLNVGVFNDLSNGNHALYIYASDLAGNQNYSMLQFNKDTILPVVNILSPGDNSHFNSSFEIVGDNDDIHFDAMWYYIENESITSDLVYNGENWSATIQPGDFAGFDDGSHVLHVLGNDTAGNINETSITFIKDTVLPQIIVNLPSNFTYQDSTFELNATVIDENYGSMWYTVDGLNPTFFEGNATLANFDGLTEGMHQIEIHAIDLAGNENFTMINFSKDTVNPVLVLEDPVDGSFQNSTFLLNVTITDTNLEDSWYVIDGNNSWNESFTGPITISQTIFDALDQGSHSMEIFANDSASNQASITFTFTKDTIIPAMEMLLPAVNGSYYNKTFQYRISIIDTNYQGSYYKVDDLGANSTVFPANSSQVFPAVKFDALSEGSHVIYFIAEDFAGNTNMTILEFTKDTVSPIITIDAPTTNGTIYNAPFDLNTTISDNNFVDDIWYKIEGRAENHTYDGNETLVEFNELSDGDYTVLVFARDLAGNIMSSSVLFTKDITAPEILILNPSNNSYHNASFELSVEITDAHFSDTWYTIDGGAPIYGFTGNDTLSGFSGLSEGWHEVIIYANDTVGNEKNILLNISKDTVIPMYTFISPSNNSYFNAMFDINISVTEMNHDRIRMKINNPMDPGTTVSGNFSLTSFDSLSQGSHVLYFEIIDLAGNSNETTLVFTKDTVLPSIALISPSNFSIFNYAFDLEVNIEEVNLDFANYQVASEPVRSLNYNGTTTLSGADWNSIPDGMTQIMIWGQDLAGNVQTIYLNFTRDITSPSITVVNPGNNSYFNGSFEIDTTILDENIDEKWFNVNGGSNQTISGNITFDFAVLGEGSNLVNIHANDTAGNEESVIFSFMKDTIVPNITITNPSQDQIFNETFTVNTFVSDATAVTMHYYLDNMTTGPYSFNGNESISGFNSLEEGNHTIMFYAEDAAGNIGTRDLIFIKDTLVPVISVINPTNLSYFNAAFILNISVEEIYLDETWYRVDGGAPQLFSGNDTISGFDGLADGLHEVSIYANDTVGNIGSTILNFTKDTVAPEYTFNQGTDQLPYIGTGFVEKGDHVSINVTVTDVYSSISSVNIWINITGTYESGVMVDAGSGIYGYTVDPGTYSGIEVSYYFEAIDSLGNTQNSSAYSYFIVYDKEVPVIVEDEEITHDDNVAPGSTISVSASLYNWNDTNAKNVIFSLQMLDPALQPLDLEFNDSISVAASGSVIVELQTTLPAGISGDFMGILQLKTDWLANGGYTIWVSTITITVLP